MIWFQQIAMNYCKRKITDTLASCLFKRSPTMANQKIPDEVYVVVMQNEPRAAFINRKDAIKYAEGFRKEFPTARCLIMALPLLTEVPNEE
jgi:hypothetical protein